MKFGITPLPDSASRFLTIQAIYQKERFELSYDRPIFHRSSFCKHKSPSAKRPTMKPTHAPQPPLQFRPHHFLCALGFQGMGYSPAFVRNFGRIAAVLRGPQGDQTRLRVIGETDDICAPCPHRRGNACTSQERVLQLDRAHARALGVRLGDVLTWGEARRRIRERVSPTRFDTMCAPCRWQQLGICRAALKRLRAESTEQANDAPKPHIPVRSSTPRPT